MKQDFVVDDEQPTTRIGRAHKRRLQLIIIVETRDINSSWTPPIIAYDSSRGKLRCVKSFGSGHQNYSIHPPLVSRPLPSGGLENGTRNAQLRFFGQFTRPLVLSITISES